MRIDLHAHSSASDGTDSPAELVVGARAAGLDVVALTAHDTTDGWAEAEAALPAGLTLVPGIELSCRWNPPDAGPGTSLHLLGYLLDPVAPPLVDELARLRASRRSRGQRMVAAMIAAGVPVSWDDVHEFAAGGSVGRPHIARALIRAGLAGSVDEAFARFLRDGSPYYVPKDDADVLTGIRLVRAAGGVPVFAHPFARRRGRVVDEAAIVAMAAAGLAGIEVDHADHDPADRARLRALAADLGLLVTGSSDYHGTNKTVRLGAETTDQAGYERLIAQATGSTPITATF